MTIAITEKLVSKKKSCDLGQPWDVNVIVWHRSSNQKCDDNFEVKRSVTSLRYFKNH